MASRFWQLSGGIVRCAECGSALSPKARRRRGKIDSWYTCRQRYDGNGPRGCNHTRHYRADVLEEAVWGAVYGLVSDPERLRRQHAQHIERKRREMRGDPDREARILAEKLHKLQTRRSGYIDLAADGLMSREELRIKLAEADSKHQGLSQALREAEARQQSIEELERQWRTFAQLAEHFDRITYLVASDADRRRLYQALRLQVSVDAEGTIRLSGIFDPEIRLVDVLQDFPRDPSKPVPKVPESTRVVVAGSYSLCPRP